MNMTLRAMLPVNRLEMVLLMMQRLRNVQNATAVRHSKSISLDSQKCFLKKIIDFQIDTITVLLPEFETIEGNCMLM